MTEGKIIATFNSTGATVQISDAAFAGLAPEQLRRNRGQTQRVASRILRRAMERGEVEGLPPEEWHRRYGKEVGYGNG